jgi:hypothetical protein
MNLVKKVKSWFRPSDVDAERLGEARRMRADRETIRGSQDMLGYGPGYVSPTPDVLHPDEKR